MTSLGLQIGWIVALIVIPFGVLVTAFLAVMWRRAEDELSGWSIATCLVGAFTAIGIIIAAITAFPYNPRYWQLYSIAGTVENIDTSVQSAGKSISNYYVITLSGHDEYYVTENPRILDLKGRDVDLVCYANYVYQGANNYDCNIRSIGRAS